MRVCVNESFVRQVPRDLLAPHSTQATRTTLTSFTQRALNTHEGRVALERSSIDQWRASCFKKAYETTVEEVIFEPLENEIEVRT